jgi:putative transposase
VRAFEFVDAEKANHHVATMCRVLGFSTSGYYAWRGRPPSARAEGDRVLSATIAAIHRASRGTYGSPRIHAELADDHGIGCGRKRVARLMRSAGLQGCHRRRSARTTVPGPMSEDHAVDLVKRVFGADGIDKIWVADITYVPTWEGFLYLAVVVDAFSRKVVGWSMAEHLRTELVLDALEMALWNRRPAPGVIHHSDHGCQYTSVEFGRRCRLAGIRPSLGSVGDCFDNALCESFFATLECELIDRNTFPTRAEARQAVFEFIEAFYNRRRRHSALGYRSPDNYEAAHQQRQAA